MEPIPPSTILTLARDNNVDAIEQAVLTFGLDPNWGNAINQTATHIAALHGNVEALSKLIQLGANPNLQNDMGQVPLHFAAHANKKAMEIVKLLLNHDADPNVIDMRGTFPYENANDEAIRALLGGPNPKVFEAASCGDVENLRSLFQEDPKLHAEAINAHGKSALHIAAEGGHAPVVELLLEKGCSPDQQEVVGGNTAAHYAVKGSHKDILKILHEYNANLDARNFQTSTYASGSWVSAGQLLGPFDQSPLHCAVNAGDSDMVEMLLSMGVDANIEDFDGRTPLHYAIDDQDEDMVQMLLKNGADATKGCKDFVSPLHPVVQTNSASILHHLLEHGADPGKADSESGWTALHIAARAGKVHAVKTLLLHEKTDVLAVNNQGNNALHIAAANGRVDVCNALLESVHRKELKERKNGEGRAACEMAKNDDVKTLLNGP